ncbi:RDD family protein [Pendulispora rubella]|uniref:RDD family protein n=1 Tax=Pendulispora rubella TaxID=2741070 RepID=A0ABZ2L6H6_9BACT
MMGEVVHAPLDTDVAIETPEHIVFRHRVAGPARRGLAYLIDVFVCYFTLFVVGIVVLLASGAGDIVDRMQHAPQTTTGMGVGLMLVLLFVVQWVYFVVWEAWKGTSLGKMALGLRVVTTTGRPIGFGGAALRNILRGADVLPIGYLVGFVTMLLTSRFQRLGDLTANTMVVMVDRARATAPVRLWPPAEPYELASIPDRVVLDAEERTAIELFLRRRGTLGPAREEELAAMMMDPLARRHGLHPQAPAAAVHGRPPPRASRLLALLYERAANAGRGEAPPSSRHETAGGRLSWR